MPENKFNIGDVVQVSWVGHSLPDVTVVCLLEETPEGHWYLRTREGRLFTQNPSASNFEGIWEQVSEVIRA